MAEAGKETRRRRAQARERRSSLLTAPFEAVDEKAKDAAEAVGLRDGGETSTLGKTLLAAAAAALAGGVAGAAKALLDRRGAGDGSREFEQSASAGEEDRDEDTAGPEGEAAVQPDDRTEDEAPEAAGGDEDEEPEAEAGGEDEEPEAEVGAEDETHEDEEPEAEAGGEDEEHEDEEPEAEVGAEDETDEDETDEDEDDEDEEREDEEPEDDEHEEGEREDAAAEQPEGAAEGSSRDDRDDGPESGAVGDGAPTSDLRRVIETARRQLGELVGSEPESVSRVERVDGGWRVGLEVVELSRVPDSTDVLCSYDVVLSGECDVVSLDRTRRYRRSQVDGE